MARFIDTLFILFCLLVGTLAYLTVDAKVKRLEDRVRTLEMRP